jgi:uncharacterized protein YaaN involved in tellurite resistance
MQDETPIPRGRDQPKQGSFGMPHPAQPPCSDREPIKLRIEYLEKELRKMHKDLFGNGQPGALARLEGRHIRSLSEMSTKLGEIEKKVGRVMIAVAALAAAGGAGGMSVVQSIIGV